jgi:hypothetical protein
MAMVIVIGWQVYDIARQTMDIEAAALPARPGRASVQSRALVPADAGERLDGKTARPAPHRGAAGARARDAVRRRSCSWATWTGAISLADPVRRSPPCSASRAPLPGRRWVR